MALPPKGDPRRPLFLASRSMHLLGLLLIFFSTCVGVSLIGLPRRSAGSSWLRVLMFGAFAIYAVPGLCYFIFPIFMKRRKYWALIASIVLVSIHEMLAVVALVGLTITTVLNPPGNYAFRVTLVPLAFMFLVVVALGQLLWHLSQCFEALRNMPASERGFEPIMATPVLPASVPPPPAGGSSHDPDPTARP